MIKIQNGNMTITCDSVADAAELMRLQYQNESAVPEVKKQPKKHLEEVEKAKLNRWLKDEVRSVMESDSAADAAKDKAVRQRHTKGSIKFLYYIIKAGKKVSIPVQKLVDEVNAENGVKKSILDAIPEQKTTNYLG